MNPEEVISLLERIGQMISPAAQQVWLITVRNIIVQGYTCLVWAVVTLLAALVSLKVGFHGLGLQRKCNRENWRDRDSADNFTFGGFAAFVISILVFASLITSAVSYLSVPEYYAMQRLMNLLQGK